MNCSNESTLGGDLASFPTLSSRDAASELENKKIPTISGVILIPISQPSPKTFHEITVEILNVSYTSVSLQCGICSHYASPCNAHTVPTDD